jgi:hypothetical protein
MIKESTLNCPNKEVKDRDENLARCSVDPSGPVMVRYQPVRPDQ